VGDLLGCLVVSLRPECNPDIRFSAVTEPFIPRSVRGTPQEAAWDALRPGVPVGLARPLAQWVGGNLLTFDPSMNRPEPSPKLLMNLGLALDRDFPGDRYDSFQYFMSLLTPENGEFFLDAVDWCLHQTTDIEEASTVARMLNEARSIWAVARADNVFQLARQVDATLNAAVGAAAPAESAPGYHLGKAWGEVWARHGNPKTAYDEAVLAAEAATKPIVSPNDGSYTLGRGIGAMRANPVGWESPLGPKGVEAAIGVMDALWRANQRHGSETPVRVTQAQAESAVQLAVNLVGLFTSGGIARTG
jgi:hypothetical protein